MLSRVAESIYWMSRYIERAENVARFIDVNLNMMLDSTSGDQQWWPLVNTTGDHVDFEKRYGAATQESVIHFLTFDRENPNSMISCLRAARENARSVRDARRGVALLPSGPETGARRQDIPHPGCEVFHPAALRRRCRHADG